MAKDKFNINGINATETRYRTTFNINRPVYQLEEINRDNLYEKPRTSFKQKCKQEVNSWHPLKCILHSMPVLKWLPKYKWKKDFLSDIIAGITVAIMHIPQGMAYAMLGGVPPVVGIYMAFFPVMVYFLFGTSRHVSIGTFAIVCLMTGKVVNQYSTIQILQNGTKIKTQLALNEPNNTSILEATNIQVAITVTLGTAIIQLAMYILRLGVISTLLSETLVNGFTCAAAFHVVSSQLKDLFGLKTLKRRGNFSFILTIYDSILGASNANLYACGISVVCCTIIALNNEKLKPWLAKKTRIPFPIELTAVVLGTAISYFVDLPDHFDIQIVGHIPTGLPQFTVPILSLLPNIMLDAFIIAIVSYTVTLSMALIFARKLMYEVNPNQELLALGLSNLVGCFSSSITVTASLSRSMIQQTVGGVTQLASIVSCTILLIILLWIGPFFQSLPRCVLASIIVISLKGMLMQCKSIVLYWKLSKWDGIVWIVTFFTTLIFQISYGLAAGVVMSLFSVFIQSYKPYTCLLGVVPNTDLYLDVKRYRGICEIDNVKIFHYSGNLSFATRSTFKQLLKKHIGFDPASVLRKRATCDEYEISTMSDGPLLIRCVILDFTALTYIDPSGVEQLRLFQYDYEKLDILFLITGCSGPVYDVLKKCDKHLKIESKFIIFPTVHDAVLFAQSTILKEKK